MPRDAFVGIDVAVAKSKRLPICVCVLEGDALVPLPLKAPDLPRPPAMCGNVACVDRAERRRLADETTGYLRGIERRFDVRIKTIAIDAPSAPRQSDLTRRAESELGEKRISFIKTPDEATFARIPAEVAAHEAKPKAQRNRGLPHANQIWMLFGFELYATLTKAGWPCIEVYPQATVHALGVRRGHKSTEGVPEAQLQAAARYTGWPPAGANCTDAARTIGFGSLHDRVDAYLSAWVASLPEAQREPLGDPPDDVIWRPKLSG